MTPLWLIAGFLSLTEIIAGIAATQTTGGAQISLVFFVCSFPILVASAFFYILWHKPYVLYPPGDFGLAQNVSEYVHAMHGIVEKKPTSQQVAKGEEGISAAEANDVPSQKAPELAEATSKSEDSPNSPPPPDIELVLASMDGSLNDCKKAFDRISQSKMSEKEAQKLEALFAFLKFSHYGDQTGLSELENLTSKEKYRFYAWKYLGFAWRNLKDYGRAKAAFTSAEQFSSGSDERIQAVVGLADVLAKDEQYESASEVITSRIHEFTVSTELSDLYESLSKVYEAKGDLFLRALSLEKALSYTPTNHTLRFDAAWSYSQKEMNHMSLFHYDALISIKNDSPGGINNLAVQCERLQMPIAAVRLYHESLKQKESLAGANLAYLYIRAGFADEAKKLLADLRLQPDAHVNVGNAWSALAEAEKNEKEIMKDALRKGHSLQKVLRQLADAYFTTKKELLFSGTWMLTNDIQITIREDEGQIFAEWKDGDYSMNLTGTVHGYGAQIHLKKEARNASFITLLAMENFEIDGFACLDSSNNKLSVFNFEKDDPSILSFTRVLRLSK